PTPERALVGDQERGARALERVRAPIRVAPGEADAMVRRPEKDGARGGERVDARPERADRPAQARAPSQAVGRERRVRRQAARAMSSPVSGNRICGSRRRPRTFRTSGSQRVRPALRAAPFTSTTTGAPYGSGPASRRKAGRALGSMARPRELVQALVADPQENAEGDQQDEEATDRLQVRPAIEASLGE